MLNWKYKIRQLTIQKYIKVNGKDRTCRDIIYVDKGIRALFIRAFI